jgi:hypothetical protein
MSTYIVGNMPSTDVLRNESERIILLIAWNAIGQEILILANFIVKWAKGQNLVEKILVY